MPTQIKSITAHPKKAAMKYPSCKNSMASNLSFDPFLNSQDPCTRYEVRDQFPDSVTVRFNVYAVCGGERSETPDAQVIVQSLDSGWVFVNIVYGMEGTDLLALLRRPVSR